MEKVKPGYYCKSRFAKVIILWGIGSIPLCIILCISSCHQMSYCIVGLLYVRKIKQTKQQRQVPNIITK